MKYGFGVLIGIFLLLGLTGRAFSQAQGETDEAQAQPNGAQVQPAETQPQPAEHQAQPVVAQPQPAESQAQPQPAEPQAPPEAATVEPMPHAVQQVPAQPVPLKRPQRKPGRGLVMAGWITAGVGYFMSIIPGTIMAGNVSRGWYFFIPLAGSYMYGGHFIRINQGDEFETSLRFVAILAMFPSIIQTTGLILAIAGHIKGARWKREQGESQLALVPIGPRGSQGLSITGRF